MLVTFSNGMFVAHCTYEERALPKLAGFVWHGGYASKGFVVHNKTVYNKCDACGANVPHKVWYTKHADAAYNLKQYCDESALEALKGYEASLVTSSAKDDTTIDIPSPQGRKYLPYQRAGIAYALKRRATLLADEMGLGKTVQALGVINSLQSKRVLVVCPASLKLNWKREANRWLVGDSSIQVISNGTDKVDHTARVVIVNYALLRNGVLAQLKSVNWDMLVVDECHALKNPKTARSKAVLGEKKKGVVNSGIIDSVAKEGRVLFLTGTPILNRPIELFPLLNALDPKTWANPVTFGVRYCAGHKEIVGRNKVVWNFSGASNLEELQNKLRSSIMVRRLKEDVLAELPPKRRQLIELNSKKPVKVSDKLASFEKELDLAIGLKNKKEFEEATHKLDNGFSILFEEITKVRKEIAIAKIPAAIKLIEQTLENTDKLVVFAHHHEVIDVLKEHFNACSVVVDGRIPQKARQTAVDSFQNDKGTKLFIGSIRAAGVGLTLTAASIVLFIEQDWVPSLMIQAEDRVHRIGQRNSVLVLYAILNGTIDAKMAKVAIKKQVLIERALDIKAKKAKKTEQANVVKSVAKKGRGIEAGRKAAAPSYSAEEKEAVVAALQYLAGVCDGALDRDGCGFNKFDTGFGRELADRSQWRTLTDKEIRAAKKMMFKYNKQLDASLVHRIYY